MKKPLIGMMALGCALFTAAQVAASGAGGIARAEQAETATNLAVRMALPQSLDPLAPFRSKPAVAPAFSYAPDAFGAAEIAAPPLRITDTYRMLERPFADDIRSLDLEIALGGRTASGLELTLAPRAGLAIGPEGRTAAGAGAELRIGQGLRGVVEAFDPSSAQGSWYLFAATDGSALTWRPDSAQIGVNGLRFQEERVVVGDAQIGISAELNGMQASLSFVNREISNGKESTDQNFVGATLTWRR